MNLTINSSQNIPVSSLGLGSVTLVADQIKKLGQKVESSVKVPLGEYEGEWPNGRGKMKTFRLTVEGTFQNGIPVGPCKGSFLEPEVLQEKIKEGFLDARALMSLPQLGTFEAVYKDGKGTGTYIYPNGDTYVGDWIGDNRHGKGKFSWYDKSEESDLSAVIGDCFLSDPNTYEGDFVNDQFHGKGKMTWSIGESYEGEFKRGEKEGTGKYFYSNGNTYEGEWKDNQRHGKGTYTTDNGDVYVGEWSKGELHGPGILTMDSGMRLKLDYKDGELISRVPMK